MENHRYLYRSRFLTKTLASALGLAVTMLSGCNWIGYAADVIGGGDQAGQVNVEAQYRGLENQTVAVLVSADEYALFEHPTAAAAVCRQASSQLATEINGVHVLNPQQIDQFQKNNPYWNTIPYGELLDRLGVERLVLIDLITYALRDPGNSYEWRGQIVANIGVCEAQAADPDQFAFATTLQAYYPQGRSIGLIHSDRETTRMGLHNIFSQKLLHLFKDHETTRP